MGVAHDVCANNSVCFDNSVGFADAVRCGLSDARIMPILRAVPVRWIMDYYYDYGLSNARFVIIIWFLNMQWIMDCSTTGYANEFWVIFQRFVKNWQCF